MSPNLAPREVWSGGESMHHVDHADRYDRQLAPVAEAPWVWTSPNRRSRWQPLGANEWLTPVVRAVSRYAAVPDLGGLAGGARA